MFCMAGIHVTVSEAYEQCGGIVTVEVGAGPRIPDIRTSYDIPAEAFCTILPCRSERLPIRRERMSPQARIMKNASRAGCYVQRLLTVYSYVCGYYSERECECGNAYSLAPTLEQDETVERHLAVALNGLAVAALDCRVDDQAREGYHERHGEQQVEVVDRMVYV